MITTILLGFSDANGLTAPKIISGLDATTLEQITIFDDAKVRHKFPDGIKRVVRANVELTDVAVFIHDDLAGQIEAGDKKRAKAESKSRAAAKEIQKSQTAASESWGKVKKAASTRNDLMGRLNSERAKLRNLVIAPDGLRDKKTWQASIDAIRLIIVGDPAKKVAGLETQVAEAVAEYDKALAAHESLTKPAEQSAPVSQLQGGETHSPTVAEFVAAGYNPANYPPSGCKSVSTIQEVAAAIEKFNAEKSKA